MKFQFETIRSFSFSLAFFSIYIRRSYKNKILIYILYNTEIFCAKKQVGYACICPTKDWLLARQFWSYTPPQNSWLHRGRGAWKNSLMRKLSKLLLQHTSRENKFHARTAFCCVALGRIFLLLQFWLFCTGSAPSRLNRPRPIDCDRVSKVLNSRCRFSRFSWFYFWKSAIFNTLSSHHLHPRKGS